MDLKYFARNPGVEFTHPKAIGRVWRFSSLSGPTFFQTRRADEGKWMEALIPNAHFFFREDFHEVAEELRPCPICGSTAAITKNLHGHSIDCGGCGLNLWKSCERDLIKTWNQRAKEGAKQ